MLDVFLDMSVVMLGGLSLISFMVCWIAVAEEGDFYNCSKQIVLCLVLSTLLFISVFAKAMKHFLA